MIQSSRGSALLIVVLLTSFALVSFTAFSSIVRESLKSQSKATTGDLLALDNYSRSLAALGSGILPTDYSVEAIGFGNVGVYSGSLTDLNWTQSGSLTLNLTTGAPFCYSGMDG